MASPVEEIKSRLSVQDVVGSYVRLIKAGANFKANCPFHNEKTPSFFISPSRETWHCFGCGAGGDIFQFIKQIEGVEFPEALEILASRAGVVIKREDPRLISERKRWFDLMEEATKYFEAELKKNKEALDYLKGRGVTDESVRSFRLGYALYGWDGLFNHLSSRGFKPEEMEKTGLVLRSQNPNARTKFYDRFRSRIMFPIADASGRVVAFSGRIFERAVPVSELPKMGGKYINSPQTALFDKSRILYLWDRAKNEVRRENACVLVEGQMDALMSHQAGVKNVVATSGTALTREHLFQIKRLTPRLLLSFDTDEAGENATRRSVDLALRTGMEVSVIHIEGAKDPADIIKESPGLWKEAAATAKPVIAFFLELARSKFSNDLHKLRSEVNSKVLGYVAAIENQIEKAHWVGEVARALALREEPIWDELKKINPKKNDIEEIAAQKPGRKPETRKDLLEERILGLIFWKKNNLGEFFGESEAGKKSESSWDVEIIKIKDLFSDGRQKLLECAIKERLPTTDGNIKNQLEKLAMEAELLYGEMKLHEEFQILLNGLELEYAKSRLEALAEKIRVSEAAGEKKRLEEQLKEFGELSKILNTK